IYDNWHIYGCFGSVWAYTICALCIDDWLFEANGFQEAGPIHHGWLHVLSHGTYPAYWTVFLDVAIKYWQCRVVCGVFAVVELIMGIFEKCQFQFQKYIPISHSTVCRCD